MNLLHYSVLSMYIKSAEQNQHFVKNAIFGESDQTPTRKKTPLSLTREGGGGVW